MARGSYYNVTGALSRHALLNHFRCIFRGLYATRRVNTLLTKSVNDLFLGVAQVHSNWLLGLHCRHHPVLLRDVPTPIAQEICPNILDCVRLMPPCPALQDAQELCRNNRALSREDVRTMLAELKKEVRQRIYEEIIGKLNAWGVETDTKLGNSNDVNQGISSCTVA